MARKHRGNGRGRSSIAGKKGVQYDPFVRQSMVQLNQTFGNQQGNQGAFEKLVAQCGTEDLFIFAVREQPAGRGEPALLRGDHPQVVSVLDQDGNIVDVRGDWLRQ